RSDSPARQYIHPSQVSHPLSSRKPEKCGICREKGNGRCFHPRSALAVLSCPLLTISSQPRSRLLVVLATLFPLLQTPSGLAHRQMLAPQSLAKELIEAFALARRLHPQASVPHEQTQLGSVAMSQRQTNLLWLKDLLEHLTPCQQQLEWAEDNETVCVLTESMLSDLERCKRLCEAIRRRASSQSFA